MSKRITNRFLKISLWIVAGAVVLLAGIALGWFLFNSKQQTTKYNLLDPTAGITTNQQSIINFDPVRQQVKDYLNGLDTSYGLYFEYLPNGTNIRADEDSVSVAASLMKVPVVMDLYKLADVGVINLEDTVMIEQGDVNADHEYGDPSGLLAGQTISLSNAARLALNNSDNTAISIVKRVIAPLLTNETDSIQSLDIAYTLSEGDSTSNAVPDKELKINARSYGSILKCLYYSCFVNPADSQEILSYLVGSVGTDRLSSAVPKNIQVAHKVGSSIKAQSDCGIIYVPGQPYLICLMFWDFQDPSGKETTAYFNKVSKMIYDYISKTKIQ